jgi:hypothetical protein
MMAEIRVNRKKGVTFLPILHLMPVLYYDWLLVRRDKSPRLRPKGEKEHGL